jgi:hypothetical protein
MAVVFISPVLASATAAAKISKPAAQKKSREQAVTATDSRHHSLCTNTNANASTKH